MSKFYYITEKSDIQCGHGGKMNLAGLGNPGMTIDGAAVVTESKLAGATFVGCAQSPPTEKPCATIPSLAPDMLSKVPVDGDFMVLSSIYGKAKTDGGPPGTVVGDAKT